MPIETAKYRTTSRGMITARYVSRILRIADEQGRDRCTAEIVKGQPQEIPRQILNGGSFFSSEMAKEMIQLLSPKYATVKSNNGSKRFLIGHCWRSGREIYSSDKEEQARGNPDSDWECADIEHNLVKRMVLPDRTKAK